jgi:hypothetical protein
MMPYKYTDYPLAVPSAQKSIESQVQEYNLRKEQLQHKNSEE